MGTHMYIITLLRDAVRCGAALCSTATGYAVLVLTVYGVILLYAWNALVHTLSSVRG